jgi:hypothetical protein
LTIGGRVSVLMPFLNGDTDLIAALRRERFRYAHPQLGRMASLVTRGA